MRKYLGHFSLWGDFKPDEITTALGLQPSAVYPKGEIWEGAEQPAKVATWDLHCPCELLATEQISFLLDRLRPSVSIVRQLSGQHTGAFNLCCEGESIFSLRAQELHELANLNVQLNCFLMEAEA